MFSQSEIRKEALQRQTDFVRDFLSVVKIDLSTDQAAARGAIIASFTNAFQGADTGNKLLPILLAALGAPPAPPALAVVDGDGDSDDDDDDDKTKATPKGKVIKAKSGASSSSKKPKE